MSYDKLIVYVAFIYGNKTVFSSHQVFHKKISLLFFHDAFHVPVNRVLPTYMYNFRLRYKILTIPAPQPPSRSTQYHIINCTSSHQTHCPIALCPSTFGGMVFFEKQLEDGEIEPDSSDERLQEDDGELSDDTS